MKFFLTSAFSFFLVQVCAETRLPLKVFVLAGQSNMQGAGAIRANPRSRNGGMGTLEYLVEAPSTAEHYRHLIDRDGNWVEREDVWIWYLDRKGKLRPGFGAHPGAIGPELQFGNVIGDYFENQVLLIKCAWGGKSLGRDFRPPSAGGEVGPFYTKTMNHVKEVLADIKSHFPEYDGRGYELAGFGWHQGWNDRVNQAFTDAYEENLVHFIRDLRKELGVKNLPFVIAETGMGGLAVKHGRALKLMKAQEAGAMRAEFKGTAAFVSTRPFWRTSEESPSGQGYHWNSNAETYCLMGEGMGLAMIGILDQPVEERIKLALENAQTKQERSSLCRKLMKESPYDYGLQGLCLAEIARQLGAKAFDDVLAGLNHQNAWVRRTARQLAIELPDSGTLKWVDYMSESDLRLSLELMGVLRAHRNAKWLLKLNSPDAHKREGLRIAALRALHDLESKASMEAVARATSDKSQKIRRTAFAVLVSSNAPSATEALLMLAAKADRIQAHVEAMTHCFRRFAFGKIPEKARGPVLDKLISIARRPDEKRLALVELQKIPSIGTLATAHALSKDSDLRKKASLAAIAIAEAMKLDDEKVKEKAVSLIEKVMKASKVKATRDAAERFIYKHRRPSLEDFDPELAP